MLALSQTEGVHHCSRRVKRSHPHRHPHPHPINSPRLHILQTINSVIFSLFKSFGSQPWPHAGYHRQGFSTEFVRSCTHSFSTIQRTIGEPVVYKQCNSSAQCTSGAPTWLYSAPAIYNTAYISTASPAVHWRCTSLAPAVHRQCPSSAPKVYQQCPTAAHRLCPSRSHSNL